MFMLSSCLGTSDSNCLHYRPDGRVRLFLDLEEQAWRKRVSLEQVQERRAAKLRTERLTLLQALNLTDPLLLLQTVQNPDWVDLFDETTCKQQILDAVEWKRPKRITAAKISPLLQTVCRTFSGEDIVLNAASAHSSLRLNADHSALWVTADAVPDSGVSGSPEALYRVLGETPFSRGVHHWEVAVAGVPCWAVGVAYGSAGAPAATSCSLGRDELSWALSYSSRTRQFCAQHGWLCFCFSDSATGLPDTIGVFLDIDSGFLSFYDAVGMGHLYTFYCDIHAPVYPAFCLGSRSTEGGNQQMRVLNPISGKSC
ncbi:E3 ubiquitin-protein ligase TRIM69-like [Brachyhypopomus gauderio]|uniref:E3 ubiquitin-protein ligase TRIM69-like n=1 Tax=Brachyhypopomus gauderio TaxID=698409 RepID=UPI0040419B84